MKVVFLADSISTQNAGIHYYGMQLVENIVKSYPENTYQIISTKQLNITGVDDVVVPMESESNISLRIRQLLKLPKIVNKLNPDIAIELAHFGPFRLNKNITRATVIHDLTPITHPQFHGFLSTLSHKVLLPKIISKAKHIICNSATTKNAVQKKYKVSSSKLFVAYPKPEAVQFLGLDREDFFVTIGTIEPRKNYVKLIKAFNIYKSKGGVNKLVIIGSKGWKMPEVQEILEDNEYKDAIKILHDIDREEIFKYLAKAKAFVSASHYEGFGLPVLEAMSQQTPLLLSDIEAYHEIADGVAIFFDQNNLEDISEAMFNVEKNAASNQALQQRYLQFKSAQLNLPFLESN